MTDQELDSLVKVYGDVFGEIERTGGHTSYYIDGKLIIYESPREIFSILIFGRLRAQNLVKANDELRRIIE